MDAANTPLRILVADDNDLMRTGLRALLEEHVWWTICGEATGGVDAIQKALQLKPDVILLDVSMPDLNGFQVARRIHQQLPDAAILIVTEHDSSSFENADPQPGVCGYVMKSRASSDLVAAVEVASRLSLV